MAGPRLDLPKGRVDERNTVFARMARRPGTGPYEDFYSRRPDLRAGDDRLRAMPELCRPGGRHYDPAIARETEEYFARIGEIEPNRRLAAEAARRMRAAPDPTRPLRDFALSLGAVAAGFAPVPREFVYTVKGRHDADYGRPVDLDHPRALVFLVEMDHAAMRRAPRAEAIRESARQYYRAAHIAKTVERALSLAGWSTKAHYDAHYDVILPPLAVLAGLGEIGRNNILVADRFGSRVRIGAVTTDAPVRPDRPVSLGVARFCEVCMKCAENCPSRALSTGPRERCRGVAKWPTKVERCYAFWRQVGTDCGVCMACCPFSHPDRRIHAAVRWVVRRFPILHRAAVLLDDLVYGRRWRSR